MWIALRRAGETAGRCRVQRLMRSHGIQGAKQLGHADPKFTLRVYAHQMRRGNDERARLKALVEGRDWAPMGTGSANEPPRGRSSDSPSNDKSPARTGLPDHGRGWVRTSDLSRVKRALSH
jgi:HTH-like domain